MYLAQLYYMPLFSRGHDGLVCCPKRQGGPWVTPRLPFSGCLGLFPGVKLPGLEADHPRLRSTKVKKEWCCTFTSTNAFTSCAEKISPLFIRNFL